MAQESDMFAPGWPGIPAHWTSSAKSGLGTALSRDSRALECGLRADRTRYGDTRHVAGRPCGGPSDDAPATWRPCGSHVLLAGGGPMGGNRFRRLGRMTARIGLFTSKSLTVAILSGRWRPGIGVLRVPTDR